VITAGFNAPIGDAREGKCAWVIEINSVSLQYISMHDLCIEVDLALVEPSPVVVNNQLA
jgi:hypothetical protein